MNSKKYFTSKWYIILTSSVPLSQIFLYIVFRPQGPLVNKLGIFIIFVCVFVFFLSMAFHWNYPELNKDELEIANVLYGFYSYNYRYEEIKKVEVTIIGRAGLGLKIFTTRRERPYWHITKCMSTKSITSFLYDLNSKGVFGICTLYNPPNK